MKHKMKSFLIVFFILFLRWGVLSAQETERKPTREEIVAFLDEFRNTPLSDEEKKVGWNERKKADLVEKFGSDFSGLNLSSVDFKLITRKVVAQGADFSGCNMQAVFFDGADLQGCCFKGADLRNAIIRSCECENADFSNSKIEGTQFLYSKMQRVEFANLNAKEGKFYGIDFSGSNLSHTVFAGADFWFRGEFNSANMSGTDLSGVLLENADLTDACLMNAKFLKTNLTKANFTGANLEGADFTGAKLYAAVFDNVQGVDAAQKKSLESRSMKWFYNLTIVLWGILVIIFYPGFFLTVLLVLVFSIYGLTRKEKSKLFVTAFVLNVFALFSTACTFLMLFSGGHPVIQMSGNLKAWSLWLDFWPFLAMGMFLAIAVVLIVFIICLARLIMRKKVLSPRWTLFYLLLTILHTFWAIQWLGMFMPDA